MASALESLHEGLDDGWGAEPTLYVVQLREAVLFGAARLHLGDPGALESLHEGLDDGWGAEPTLYVVQLREAVLFGGADAEVSRAQLYSSERPPDALTWLKVTRLARQDNINKARYTLFDVLHDDVVRPEGGPGCHAAALAEECEWTVRGESSHEKIRESAARCLRAAYKRDADEALDPDKARALAHAIQRELHSTKTPWNKTRGMGTTRELYKLCALLVERFCDASADEGEDPDDPSFVPWPEISKGLADKCEAERRSILNLTPKGERVSGGPKLEGCLAATERLSRTAAFGDTFATPGLWQDLERLIDDYAEGVYTGFNYGVPAMALRCVRRMAPKLAPAMIIPAAAAASDGGGGRGLKNAARPLKCVGQTT